VRIEFTPELRVVDFGCVVVSLEVTEADGSEDSLGSLETFGLSEVWSGSSEALNVLADGELVLGSQEFDGGGGISRGNGSSRDSTLDGVSQGVLSVGGPDSLEVWLLGNVLWKLMWVDEVLLLDDLWGELR
jgi:hypothetical protein